MGIEKMEQKAAEFNAATEVVNKISSRVKAEINKTCSKHLCQLNEAVQLMQRLEAELLELIDQNHDQFKKPKSKSVHNVKFGLRKGKGSLEVKNKEKTIALLKKRFRSDAQSAYIKIEENLLKSGLQQLDGKFLKEIGVSIKAGEDRAFVEIQTDRVDDFVKLLQEIDHG